MMTLTERFVLFLVVVIVGTLGATAAVTTTSSATPFVGSSKGFLPRQTAFCKSVQRRPKLSEDEHDNDGVSVAVSSSLSTLFRLRAGEISIPDEEDEEDQGVDGSSSSGLVATKLRNLIRSILQISDDKVPLVSGVLRTFFKTVESITGMNLLPKETTTSKSKSSKSKSKSSRKSKTKQTTNDETAQSDDKSSSSSSSSTTKKTSSKSKKKASSKKASAATKKHLQTSIKSTNPNYRIQKELKAFLKSPPDNLSVQVGSNIRLWIVTIVGAKDTIYEGEIFKLRIEFPKDYPTVPPSVYFLKKFMPVHEHVYTNGDICLSLLGNGWRPTMSAQSIAVSILSILSSAQKKCLPMDNANHAGAKPGQYQKDWVYHDDNC